jgi:hypothetical protein
MDISIFEDMTFNPFAVAHGEMIWDRYPRLKIDQTLSRLPVNLEELRETVDGFLAGEDKITERDLSLMISFVVLFVDRSSPFVEEKDFNNRISLCLKALKITEDDRVHIEIVENSVYWQEVLAAYFKLIHNVEYETWFAMKMNLHFMSKLLSSNTTDMQQRRMAASSLPDFESQLLKKQHKLFPDEQTARYMAARETDQRISGLPEEFALDLNT